MKSRCVYNFSTNSRVATWLLIRFLGLAIGMREGVCRVAKSALMNVSITKVCALTNNPPLIEKFSLAKVKEGHLTPATIVFLKG